MTGPATLGTMCRQRMRGVLVPLTMAASMNSRRRKLKVIPGQAQSLKREEPPRRRRAEEEVLDEVDKVLDKISTHGMASLTAEERKLLDEVSKRYRQN